VIAELADAGYHGIIARVTSADSFIPLGDAAAHVLVSEADIEQAAQQLLQLSLRPNLCSGIAASTLPR
jgi:2-oxoisovalerate dehydrogenase E1 component